MARQRRWVMGITSVSHGVNHMNSQMVNVLYALMMTPLGFGYAELGLINAVHGIVGQGLQATYGFITQFVRRSVILGTGMTNVHSVEESVRVEDMARVAELLVEIIREA